MRSIVHFYSLSIKATYYPYFPMNIAETFTFNQVSIVANRIEYALNGRLEIRHLSIYTVLSKNNVCDFNCIMTMCMSEFPRENTCLILSIISIKIGEKIELLKLKNYSTWLRRSMSVFSISHPLSLFIAGKEVGQQNMHWCISSCSWLTQDRYWPNRSIYSDEYNHSFAQSSQQFIKYRPGCHGCCQSATTR
jgi:hypothetical protein